MLLRVCIVAAIMGGRRRKMDTKLTRDELRDLKDANQTAARKERPVSEVLAGWAANAYDLMEKDLARLNQLLEGKATGFSTVEDALIAQVAKANGAAASSRRAASLIRLRAKVLLGGK